MKEIEDEKLKSKIILATCSSVGENAINEVLKRPETENALKQDRIAREFRYVEELFVEISKNNLASYGLKETKNAAIAGAVKTLLITDSFIQQKRIENKYEELLNDDDLKLVSLMYVNNEIGNIIDVDKVSDLCKKNNSFFHTDAVQAVGHYKIDLKKTQIDFLSASAHKFHGPKGVGFSFIRKTSRLSPFICGGPQERGLRAGTESVHNIVGMTRALEISYNKISEESKYISSIKEYTINELKSLFPKIHFNGLSGNLDRSTYTILNVCFPLDNEKGSMLDFHLDLNGIACSKGSACQSGSSSGSHVLNEIQTDDLKKYPSVRFSFSHYNTKKEVDYLIDTINKLINTTN